VVENASRTGVQLSGKALVLPGRGGAYLNPALPRWRQKDREFKISRSTIFCKKKVNLDIN
jgi:hypothetical protein